MELHDQEDRVFETNYAVVDYTETLEDFYSESLNWVVSPDDFHKDFHINSEPIRNAKRLERFYASEVGRHIKDNVTQCSNLQEYAAHMRGVLLLHTRANVYSALRTEPFDQMRAENSPFMLRLYNDDLHEPEFQQLEVSSVAASEKLLHITVESEDEELNRHLVETSLRGMTLCLARVTRAKTGKRCPIPMGSSRRDVNSSGLCFALIRKVALLNFDGDELDRNPDEGAIHQCVLRVSLPRKTLKDQNFAVQVGSTFHFTPLMTLTTEIRMARAIPRVGQIPEYLRRFLYGEPINNLVYSQEQVLHTPSNSVLGPLATGVIPRNHANIRQMVLNHCDEGSLVCSQLPSSSSVPSRSTSL